MKPRTDELRIRLSGDGSDRKQLERDARKQKMPLSNYVRFRLNLPLAQRGRPKKAQSF